MNYDDATIYYNDKNPDIRNYSVFDEPHFLENFRRNLRVFLPINVWWVDIYCTLTVCWICTRCNYIEWGSTQLSVSRSHSCTAIHNFPQKKTVYILDEKGRFIILGYTEAFKIAHARKTSLCYTYSNSCWSTMVNWIIHTLKAILPDRKDRTVRL